MRVQGILTKYTYSIWDNDRGDDISGYTLTIQGHRKQFALNKKTKSGVFFIKNKNILINNNVIFNCDEWGYRVKFDKDFMERFN